MTEPILTKSESGWVIEIRRGLDGLLYYGKVVHGLGTTIENADAIRFARKQDADAVLEDLRAYDLNNVWIEAVAAEHMWIGDEK